MKEEVQSRSVKTSRCSKLSLDHVYRHCVPHIDTDRQTDRQTHRHTHTHTCSWRDLNPRPLDLQSNARTTEPTRHPTVYNIIIFIFISRILFHMRIHKTSGIQATGHNYYDVLQTKRETFYKGCHQGSEWILNKLFHTFFSFCVPP